MTNETNLTDYLPHWLASDLLKLRRELEPHFRYDTKSPSVKDWRGGSHGHCAAVALIVWAKFGGFLVSAKVNGESHWFNRIRNVDVDLTGDQFGRPSPVWHEATKLYPETKMRRILQLHDETVVRATVLAERALQSHEVLERLESV